MARASSICAVAGCPQPAVSKGKCPPHLAEDEARQRRSTPTKVVERRERTMRRKFVEDWIARNGYVCPGYKRPPHASRDLTVEHTRPVADSASYTPNTSDWTVLCRSCNSRHGAETANRFR